MEKTISDFEKISIYSCVQSLIASKGLKAATMDGVASSLGMSKRTLYEIFGSKDQLITETLAWVNRQNIDEIERVFSETNNVLEACIRLTLCFSERMQSFSPEFFRDMDRLYLYMRSNYEELKEERRAKMLNLFHKGVEQGVFRSDIDYNVFLEMLDLQMEALKRSEGKLPSDISIAEIHTTMMLVSLRGISSTKGIKVFDEIMPRFTKSDSKITINS